MGRLTRKFLLITRNIKVAIQSIHWQKDSTIVVVGSWFGEKFADNSRFLYQYLSENKKILGLNHVVWISRSQAVVTNLRNMGYEAYVIDSKESIEFHKRAKYHIICNSASGEFGENKSDIFTSYSWGAVRINVWHGILAFKGVSFASNDYIREKQKHKILFGIREFLLRYSIFRKFYLVPGGWGDCYYLSTTPTATETMKKFFRLPSDYYIETGEPRVSCKVRVTEEEQEIIDYIKSFKKSILYLPTFRNEDSAFDFTEASKGLQSYLKENDYLWIQKFHSASRQRHNEVIDLNNVLNLPHDFDINLIIPIVDMVVSDYSSVIGDAMYFYKPIAFFVPDFEEYQNDDRGFVVNLDDHMCGPRAKDIKELQRTINDFLKVKFKPDKKYLLIREKYFGKGKTMKEIWDDILNVTK